MGLEPLTVSRTKFSIIASTGSQLDEDFGQHSKNFRSFYMSSNDIEKEIVTTYLTK